MRIAYFVAVTLIFGLAAKPALSQNAQDPNMSCADYLKLEASMGPTPSTGDAATDKMAADLDAKMKAYCTANPKATVADATMKVMGN